VEPHPAGPVMRCFFTMNRVLYFRFYVQSFQIGSSTRNVAPVKTGTVHDDDFMLNPVNVLITNDNRWVFMRRDSPRFEATI